MSNELNKSAGMRCTICCTLTDIHAPDCAEGKREAAEREQQVAALEVAAEAARSAMNVDRPAFRAAATPAFISALLAERKAQAERLTLMTYKADNLDAELSNVHARLAAETLRADQGWERYESANRSRQITEAQLAATPAQTSGADVPNDGMHASIFVKVWGDAGGGDAGRIALAEYAYRLGQQSTAAQPVAPVAKAEPVPELSNADIRTLMHNYSRMHQPGHYSDTEFDCLQDVIGFVRDAIAAAQPVAANASESIGADDKFRLLLPSDLTQFLRDEIIAYVDAWASRRPAAAPVDVDANTAQLFKFYNVSTFEALVLIQDKHITRLQAKLPKLVDANPRTPREG